MVFQTAIFLILVVRNSKRSKEKPATAFPEIVHIIVIVSTFPLVTVL